MVNKILVGIGISIFFISLLVGISFFAVQQSIFKEPVWLPTFGRIECVQYSYESETKTIPKKGTNFFCGKDVYVPQERKCTYLVTQKIGGSLNVQECKKDGTSCKTMVEGVGGIPGTKTYRISSGNMIKINPLLREATARETAISYRLNQIDSGYKQVDVTGCRIKEVSVVQNDANNKNVKYETNPFSDEINLAPDTIYHYITRLSEDISANTVTSSKFNSGKPIYVHKIGAYYPIVNAQSGPFEGKLVADTNNEVTDARIKCLPASDFCDSDTLEPIPQTEKKCSDTLGLIGQYVPRPDGTYCKTACNKQTNKLYYTTDCKTIQKCPSDKPLLDPKTLTCMAGHPPPDNRQQLCAVQGGIWVEKNVETCGGRVLCELGITQKEISNENFCKPKTYWQYLVIGFLALIALLLVTQPKRIVSKEMR